MLKLIKKNMAIILTCISILDNKTLGMNQQKSSLVRAGEENSDLRIKSLNENRKGVLAGVIATLIGVTAVACIAAWGGVQSFKKNNNKVELDPSIEAEFNKSNSVIDGWLQRYGSMFRFEKTSDAFKKLKVGLVRILKYKNSILAEWSKKQNKELFDNVKNFINSLESGKIMVGSEHNQYYLIFGDNYDEGGLIYINFRADFNNAICFVYCSMPLLGMDNDGNCYTTGNRALEKTNN